LLDAMVPPAFDTVQFCVAGCVVTVTLYATPDCNEVVKVNGPAALSVRASPPLFAIVIDPLNPVTAPPTV
jgi:hypothetical protein